MKKVILAMFVVLMLLSAVSVMADGSDPMPICPKVKQCTKF